MAGDVPFPSITCMTLFFSFLLAFHFAMAVPEATFSSLTSTKDAVKKRNTMVPASSAREEQSTPNLKTVKAIHVPDPVQGPKKGSSRAQRPPFQWQNKIFNASEHEVPSGPNPISNR